MNPAHRAHRFMVPMHDNSIAEKLPMKTYRSSLPVGLLITAALLLASARAADALIPDRPEKLVFPPLKYEPPVPAQYRVQLKAGPVAYVVPDRELPLLTVSVLVHTGGYLEPAGKEGLASLAGYLLARGGTRSKTAEQLEERLDFLAALLNSGVGDTDGRVSLNLMKKDLAEGLAILREVLTAPRFQDDKITLRKQQMLQEMKQRNDDSANIEEREREFLAYGEQFFVNRLATGASVESITRADLEAFHRKWFHPANFVVTASGDFDRAEILAQLETLFADWPFAGDSAPPVPKDAKLAGPGVYLVDKDVNQGRVSMMLPGIMRDDPDYFAALVMNDILGGGGFTSRIMNRVRSDEGLAYSAGSSFPGGVYYLPPFNAFFQTKSRTVAYAVAIVLEELKRMAAEPVTDQEFDTSKRGFIDRFPRTFGTKTRVADAFGQDEFTGRYANDPEFWKKYRDRLGAVTKENIQRVAKKFLTPDQVVILVVGKEEEILKGHPDHPVTLKSLGGDRYTRLPLRDPLTLKPLTP
jgi:predicted Zn-dependent peptidase